MQIPLSPRLRACADFIVPGSRVADVGCDHGHLGIWLRSAGLSPTVYACDLRPGPLASARENARRFGVTEGIRFFLSDGLRAVPRDFDTLVCAGMGAETMVSILEAAPWLRSPAYTLVLGCQTKTALLRRYLSETGWALEQEVPVRDGKFVYTVMCCRWAPGSPLTPGQCYLSPALLAHPGPELDDYTRYILGGLAQAAQYKTDPFIQKAWEELKNDHCK